MNANDDTPCDHVRDIAADARDVATVVSAAKTDAGHVDVVINATNPVSGSINTYSSTSPSSRIDYIFPCDLLTANQVSSRVS